MIALAQVTLADFGGIEQALSAARNVNELSPDRRAKLARLDSLVSKARHLAYLNLLVQAAMLASALVSLGLGRDAYSWVVPTVVETAGVLALIYSIKSRGQLTSETPGTGTPGN